MTRGARGHTKKESGGRIGRDSQAVHVSPGRLIFHTERERRRVRRSGALIAALSLDVSDIVVRGVHERWRQPEMARWLEQSAVLRPALPGLRAGPPADLCVPLCARPVNVFIVRERENPAAAAAAPCNCEPPSVNATRASPELRLSAYRCREFPRSPRRVSRVNRCTPRDAPAAGFCASRAPVSSLPRAPTIGCDRLLTLLAFALFGLIGLIISRRVVDPLIKRQR